MTISINEYPLDLTSLWIHVDKNGNTWTAAPLIYHIVLYRNRKPCGDYEDRYCMANLETAKKAVLDFESCGELKYWQKWHNRNITVVGEYAYRSGELTKPYNALYKVDWNADEISMSAKKDW